MSMNALTDLLLKQFDRIVTDHSEEHNATRHAEGLSDLAHEATETAGELIESDNPALALAKIATAHHEAAEAHEKAAKAHQEAADKHGEKAHEEHAKASQHGGAKAAAHEKSAVAHESSKAAHEGKASEHGAKAAEHTETGDNADFNAKHSRDEAGRFDAYAKPGSHGVTGRIKAVKSPPTAYDKAKAAADKASEKALTAHQNRNSAISGTFQHAEKLNKEAGEKHLIAHKEASSNVLEEAAKYHKEKAEMHAERSGSDWDDSKHPRDENGKFS